MYIFLFTTKNKKQIKHKSWIKNHEGNFEELAEEIVNLRYDALSEFLRLLGKNLKNKFALIQTLILQLFYSLNQVITIMKFYTSIPKDLKSFYNSELLKYQKEYSNGNLNNAWKHLERAHILGQRYPFAHTHVHWKMLLFGIKIKSTKEVIGQIPRLIFGGVKSFVGKIPVGNPGGANVPPLQPFPIEKELQEIFMKSGIEN